MIKINKRYFLYFVLITILLVIHCFVISNVTLASASDDMRFQKWASEMGFFDFIYGRYNEWSGRVIIEGALFSLIDKGGNITLWKIISVILYLLYIILTALITKILVNGKIKTVYQCFIIFLVAAWPYTFYYATFNQGITWFTGSFNYFFPFVTGSVVLLFIVKNLYGQHINKWLYCSVIISTIYASNQEQMSLLLLTLMLLLTGYMYFVKRKIDIAWLVVLFLLIAGFIFAVSAPGNEVRYLGELKWFKEVDFTTITVLRKVMLGMEYTAFYYLAKSPVALLLLSIPLFSIAVLKRNFSLAFNCFILLLCFFIAVYLSKGGATQIGNAEPTWRLMFNQNLSYEVSSVLFILCIVLFLLLIPYCIILCCETKQVGVFITLLFIGGICTVFILGFSPTIFASGFRIFFVSQMLLVVVAASIYLELFKLSENSIFNLVVISVSLVIIILDATDTIKLALAPFHIEYS